MPSPKVRSAERTHPLVQSIVGIRGHVGPTRHPARRRLYDLHQSLPGVVGVLVFLGPRVARLRSCDHVAGKVERCVVPVGPRCRRMPVISLTTLCVRRWSKFHDPLPSSSCLKVPQLPKASRIQSCLKTDVPIVVPFQFPLLSVFGAAPAVVGPGLVFIVRRIDRRVDVAELGVAGVVVLVLEAINVGDAVAVPILVLHAAEAVLDSEQPQSHPSYFVRWDVCPLLLSRP